jgi:uncharacterized protein YndB with AHSA1/START domain
LGVINSAINIVINLTIMDTPYVMEQAYDVPPSEVWQALTDENKMRKWYFPQLRKFEPIVGFEFVFTNDGSTYQKEWRVTKVTGGRLLAHSWTYKGYPGNSEVTFELFEEGEKTRLRLTHTGLASFPHDPHFARHRFEDGWKQIIGTNLKNYLENNPIYI